MSIYRAQIAITADSALPRDQVMITPHYTSTDAAGLANALKTNIKALASMSTNPSFTVTIYDAQGPPPHHPLAIATNSGSTPTSTMPREVAVCVSYYAGFNQPRLRGRVYLPAGILNFTPAARVIAGELAIGTHWADALFKNIGTGNVAVVFSRKANLASPITNYWTDNEWDTVRSRGLVSTLRVVGTVP